MMPRQPDWTEVGLAGLVLGRKPAEDLGNLVLFETTRRAPTSRRRGSWAATIRTTARNTVW